MPFFKNNPEPASKAGIKGSSIRWKDKDPESYRTKRITLNLTESEYAVLSADAGNFGFKNVQQYILHAVDEYNPNSIEIFNFTNNLSRACTALVNMGFDIEYRGFSESQSLVVVINGIKFDLEKLHNDEVIHKLPEGWTIIMGCKAAYIVFEIYRETSVVPDHKVLKAAKRLRRWAEKLEETTTFEALEMLATFTDC